MVVRGRFYKKGHAWVEMQGMIVDITQDQFGASYPRVWIGDISDTRYSEVTGDEEFDKDMGIQGDNVIFSVL